MIVTVLGARPQFVKGAVVSRALADAGVAESVVHTGQHYDDRMSAVFWRELGLPGVAVNLGVGSGGHGAQTGQMMDKLESYVLERRREIEGMLLYGDTNSTLAGALVASKLHIPVFHVEAGLRSFDRAMPEEVNRVVTDHLSSLLFCPSDHARSQLAREGISAGVEVVGDVMLDAMVAFRDTALTLPEAGLVWGEAGQRRAILTVHRPSNTDDAGVLEVLLAALRALPIQVLWPVHPRVKNALSALDVPSNVVVREPLSYLEMLRALDLTDVVITDSGGLQKEAYWSKRPCITLRAETEWVETLAGGWNTLVGNDYDLLRQAAMTEPSSPWVHLYGDGAAAKRIAQSVKRHCG